MRKRTALTGFTLIELVVTLVVVAIIAAIAAPSFMTMIRTNRIVTEANDLLATLQLARSEAIKRGVQVTVLRNGNTSSDWDAGWTVFTDWNGNGQFDDDGKAPTCDTGEDCILLTQGALKGNMTLRTGAHFTAWVAYLPTGYSISSGGAGNDTFRLCGSDKNTSDARSIVVSVTGRPDVQVGTNQCP